MSTVDGNWTNWSGGSCPVSADAYVDVKWFNGAVSRNMRAGLLGSDAYGGHDLWRKMSGKLPYIIAYRFSASE